MYGMFRNIYLVADMITLLAIGVVGDDYRF